MKTIPVDRVRELDRRAFDEFGIPSLILMENAGRGLADAAQRESVSFDDLILIFCGGGNNGGDGFVAARHLFQRGRLARVILAADPATLRDDAALNYRIIQKLDVPIERFSESKFASGAVPDGAVVIIDALLGTGFKGRAREPLSSAIAAINGLKHAAPGRVTVVAADIPSGLSGDDGPAGGEAVRADVTVTFACAKPGLVKPESSAYVGRLDVVDIGIPKKILQIAEAS